MKFFTIDSIRSIMGGSGPASRRSPKGAKNIPQTLAGSLPVAESGAELIHSEDEDDVTAAASSNPGPAKQWDSPVEFLLSCISMSVGLGNVWRFPFTAYENGGGAFLIPYFVVLLLIGRPFYLLELSLGQFSSSGCLKIWDMVPPFKGVGLAQSFATFCVVTYYNVLISLAFRFLFSSFATVLPWTVCHPDLAENTTVCLPSNHQLSDLNLTKTDNVSLVASTEQYFRRSVLKENQDISNGIGLPDPALVGYLVLTWIIIFISLRKGVSSSGKVAYFTAIFPYTVMLMLLVKGLTLPGAMDGIIFLFTPDWPKLLEIKVWYAAVTQSFFSLAIGFGSLTTFSSFNKFRHNVYKDATIISVADTFTSLLAGLITFSILGHLAHELDVPVAKVVKSGAGLAFISYPEVISKFEFAPQFFAVIFFLMLITLGLGSATGLINTTINTVSVMFGLGNGWSAALVSLVGLGAGVVYTTPGGQAILELVDYYGGSMLILILAVIEISAFTWVYKTSRLVTDLNFMMDRQLGFYWRFCWTYFIPISLSFILGYTLVFYKPVAYAGIELPIKAQIAGWIIVTLGLVMTVLAFVWTLIKKIRADKSIFSPSSKWGPKDPICRIEWLKTKAEGLDDDAEEGDEEDDFEDQEPINIRIN